MATMAEMDARYAERVRRAEELGLPLGRAEARRWMETGRWTRARYDAFIRLEEERVARWRAAHPELVDPLDPDRPIIRRADDDPDVAAAQRAQESIWDSPWLAVLVIAGAILLAALGWPALGG